MITRTLARFVVEHHFSAIPADVRHETARSFLNWKGCAVGGILSDAETDRLIRMWWDIGALADPAEVARASVPSRRQASSQGRR